MICAPQLANPCNDVAVGSSVELAGRLYVSPGCVGLMVVAQSRGTDQMGRFERGVIEGLQWARIGACFVDLATPERTCGGDAEGPGIELMVDRLTRVVDYLALGADTWHLPVGVLASGLAAAAGLAVAARQAERLVTCVSCFGRPDLAPVELSEITVPTLLVAPQKNQALLKVNEEAFAQLRCTSQLAVIRDAGSQRPEPRASVACEHAVRHWCDRIFGECTPRRTRRRLPAIKKH
jgi:putative phosphoribosyl transferase